MKASSLREQSSEELQSLLADNEKEMGDLRLKKGAGDSQTQQHPLRARLLRRDRARIKTILREREISAGEKHG